MSDLLLQLKDLTQHHRANCAGYRKIVDLAFPNAAEAASLADIPYLPISLFKYRRLSSVAQIEQRITLRSSGTGGQRSQIIMDAEDAKRSSKALSQIIGSVTQGQRLPMLIIDDEAALGGKNNIDARAAAILGLMPFGREHCFALAEDKLLAFFETHKNQDILIFGFTFLVWQYLAPFLEKYPQDLSHATLLHTGGWKKLTDIAVNDAEFKMRLRRTSKISRILNFYGMAELPGTIFLENDKGPLSPPDFAAVIIRNPTTFQPQPDGQPGLVQILATLPRSYPGHSLLTEDMGVMTANGLQILGRAPRAELRGCSDVMGVAA